MRCLFLLTLLAAGLSAAQAQTPAASPAAPATLASARYSAADTIRAVQHLFQHRSKGTAGYLGTGGAVLGRGTVGLALRTDSTSEGQRVDTNQDLLTGSLLLSYGLLRTQRFGPAQYTHIVTAYAQGEPLPDYVRRRLKPKYFRYREF